MSIAEKVRNNIGRMKPGTVFMISDLPSYHEEKKATIKAVSYFYKNETFTKRYGSIKKIADGLYYKEEEGFFGKLPPSYDAVLHALIFSKNKKVGFVTGPQLFNIKGLSTQVPATTTVVTSKLAPAKIDIFGIKIEVIRKQKIEEKNIKRHELEYILNNLSKIQSIEIEMMHFFFNEYFSWIKNDQKQFDELYKNLSYKRTKAVLGALLEEYQLQKKEDIEHYIIKIKEDLSTRSKYKIGHLSNLIQKKEKWNIEF
ncbi:hypothetical protein K3H40_16620 [Aeromonas veronii]|uniref:DUF6088 family protein n=1 Tax=Aeromonas veronii TaxID=654 RepID=UPI001F258C31|nr:DUF6088 family protein [Aeromonas veronii]MCF5880686.1 hypothetical protein [Aeromonas veronii]